MKRTTRHRKSSAFSLIELLVVMAILGILATLAMLALGNLSGSNTLATTGNKIVDLINQTRQDARSQNGLGVFVVQSNRTAGYSYSPTTTNWRQTARWQTLPDGIGIGGGADTFHPAPAQPVGFPAGGANVQTVTFLPDGRPLTTNAVALEILLSNTTGPTNNFYKILINPATGVLSVQRP